VIRSFAGFQGIDDFIKWRFILDFAVPPVFRVESPWPVPVTDLEAAGARYDKHLSSPCRTVPVHVLKKLHGVLFAADTLGITCSPEASTDEDMMFRFFHVHFLSSNSSFCIVDVSAPHAAPAACWPMPQWPAGTE